MCSWSCFCQRCSRWDEAQSYQTTPIFPVGPHVPQCLLLLSCWKHFSCRLLELHGSAGSSAQIACCLLSLGRQIFESLTYCFDLSTLSRSGTSHELRPHSLTILCSSVSQSWNPCQKQALPAPTSDSVPPSSRSQTQAPATQTPVAESSMPIHIPRPWPHQEDPMNLIAGLLLQCWLPPEYILLSKLGGLLKANSDHVSLLFSSTQRLPVPIPSPMACEAPRDCQSPASHALPLLILPLPRTLQALALTLFLQHGVFGLAAPSLGCCCSVHQLSAASSHYERLSQNISFSS